ncbi:hypothetical protein HMN09_00620000 [Mycena chlorophos]|uniref:Mid2 domain-containing protein n=1 Tax=Mycena chlorophos TaxID=658473 RepID=A0A8H6T4L9_MYCCL|nr:hypothetical protein HMN09_00620000 [Mycena chlorophos]
MFINRTLSLTLLASLLLSLASVEAHDFDQPLRREHGRLIKKRAPVPQNLLSGLENVVPNPDSGSANASATGVSLSASATLSASASATGLNSTSASALSISASASASASASSLSASLFSSSSTTTTKPTTPAATPTPQAPTTPAAQAKATVTQTDSAVVNAAETSTPIVESATAQKKSTITTVLIIIGASGAGLCIVWTLLRKSLFGARKNRLADPISWQPTDDGDNGIVPAHRLARTDSRASSVHTSSQHGHAAGGYSDPVLGHDFTAAPAHLAPVGGYADLARGPSPQPQMQENLNRGPSINRSYGAAYDTGVPLHHQANYGNSAQADAYDYEGNAVRF